MHMRLTQPDKERERYYLLPGMGGRARRQKVRSMLRWGLLAGLLTSLLAATALYLFNQLGLYGH
jgi:hypothetical protein